MMLENQDLEVRTKIIDDKDYRVADYATWRLNTKLLQGYWGSYLGIGAKK